MIGETEAFDPNAVSLLWAYPEHARSIAAIHGALFDEAWTADSIKSLLGDAGATGFIATYEHPQNVIGFVLARMVADEAEILSVGVKEEFQRCGVGDRLIQAIERIMNRVDVEKIYLEVAVDNDAAIHLYRKLGYDEVGRREGYYRRPDGGFADALLLARNI